MSPATAFWSDIATTSSFAMSANELEERFTRSGSLSARRWQEEMVLDRLESLQPNWDNRGSLAPSKLTVSVARAWLENLKNAARDAGRAWNQPHISASEDGEVTFEWWKENRKITLYFGGESIEYVKVWGPNIQTEMDTGQVNLADDFRALWTWLNIAA